MIFSWCKWSRLFVLPFLLVEACRSSGAAPERGRDAQLVSAQDPPAAAPIARPQRRLLLGRWVNLATMRAEGDVSPGVPDFELNRPDLDFAVTYQVYGPFEGFRPSTGAKLWSERALPPCGSPVISGVHVYAQCEGNVLSYDIGNGSVQVVDSANEEMAANESMMVTVSRRGRLRVFDALSNRLLAQRMLPWFKQSTHVELVLAPSQTNICLVSRDAVSDHPVHSARCYDADLAPLWKRSVLQPTSRGEPMFDIRQRGPHHLVLDDQDVDAEHEAKGRGLVLRWRDGAVTRFDDGTFATIEDERGERITEPKALEVFNSTVGLLHQYWAYYGRRAWIAASGDRIFVLATNDSTGLAAIDAKTGRQIFVVQLPLGHSSSLEVAGGYPIVRTQDQRMLWHATVHDPDTGRVLYRDERWRQRP